ncbi:Hydroxymethylglutaryl-CoA lyase YngG [Pseudoruegeria aquimaris]|uniref:hydroxymethylglutaryl-CoA lyase n=1 Tax=Pseudoruegeria aquimaris TaxID=393663 RepID=A0A1Y5T1J4_9RHOB|nr:hydroxymethylglutaryl-CoA lyase [Pseudoruegeria aquimaris]SLN54022.1 Hydroxymethylglutaryl-CoA lyase YngG [Pseudoruegeria aquimaris]
MAETATIFEVGPRDGLQNEKAQIATADKIALVDMLSASGLRKIEVTSFVSPRWVPQMADAAEVMAGITRAPGVDYAVLTPNAKGFEAARAARADEIAVFASASEGFSRKNINCSVAESLARFEPVMIAALAHGIPVRGYVSCITHCPYDGAVAPEAVLDVAEKLLAMGCYEVSLGDTIGAATPDTVSALLDVLLARIPAEKLAGHFHDTHGRALDNIDVCLAAGLRTFDAAVGGLGGCPYAPGAAGNVASEAVLGLLSERGFDTGVDAARLAEATRFARSLRT